MIIKRIFAKLVDAGAVASSLAGVPPTAATPGPVADGPLVRRRPSRFLRQR